MVSPTVSIYLSPTLQSRHFTWVLGMEFRSSCLQWQTVQTEWSSQPKLLPLEKQTNNLPKYYLTVDKNKIRSAIVAHAFILETEEDRQWGAQGQPSLHIKLLDRQSYEGTLPQNKTLTQAQ